MGELFAEPPLSFLSDAELTYFFREAYKAALSSAGKPLSVSIAGRSISYGSAAEAMNVAREALAHRKLHVEIGILETSRVPFMGVSRWRG